MASSMNVPDFPAYRRQTSLQRQAVEVLRRCLQLPATSSGYRRSHIMHAWRTVPGAEQALEHQLYRTTNRNTR